MSREIEEALDWTPGEDIGKDLERIDRVRELLRKEHKHVAAESATSAAKAHETPLALYEAGDGQKYKDACQDKIDQVRAEVFSRIDAYVAEAPGEDRKAAANQEKAMWNSEILKAAQMNGGDPAINQSQSNLQFSVDNQNLTALSPTLAEIPNLKSISAQNNQLSKLPSNIARASELEQLDLRGNSLTSTAGILETATNGAKVQIDDPYKMGMAPGELAALQDARDRNNETFNVHVDNKPLLSTEARGERDYQKNLKSTFIKLAPGESEISMVHEKENGLSGFMHASFTYETKTGEIEEVQIRAETHADIYGPDAYTSKLETVLSKVDVKCKDPALAEVIKKDIKDTFERGRHDYKTEGLGGHNNIKDLLHQGNLAQRYQSSIGAQQAPARSNGAARIDQRFPKASYIKSGSHVIDRSPRPTNRRTPVNNTPGRSDGRQSGAVASSQFQGNRLSAPPGRGGRVPTNVAPGAPNEGRQQPANAGSQTPKPLSNLWALAKRLLKKILGLADSNNGRGQKEGDYAPPPHSLDEESQDRRKRPSLLERLGRLLTSLAPTAPDQSPDQPLPPRYSLEKSVSARSSTDTLVEPIGHPHQSFPLEKPASRTKNPTPLSSPKQSSASRIPVPSARVLPKIQPGESYSMEQVFNAVGKDMVFNSKPSEDGKTMKIWPADVSKQTQFAAGNGSKFPISVDISNHPELKGESVITVSPSNPVKRGSVSAGDNRTVKTGNSQSNDRGNEPSGHAGGRKR